MDLKNAVALIAQDAVPFADAIGAYCADVILLPPCRTLDRRIACHPDTLTAQLGDTLILSAAYLCEAESVADALRTRTKCRLRTSVQTHGAVYPTDVGLNSLVWERFIYARLDTLWCEVAEEAERQARTLRSVRQGYAGCAALDVGGCILSADQSILRASSADGACAVALSPGGILLPGYDYGFIGGTAGVCGKAALFFGDPERHPDGRRIRETLDAQGVETIALADAPLVDYGGIRFVPRRELQKN